MKKYLVVASILVGFLLVSCEKRAEAPERAEESDVTVYVVKLFFEGDDLMKGVVWYFGIYINDDLVFGATECGSGHPTAEQCVEFTDTFWVSDDSYEYKAVLTEGDKIQVIATVDMSQSCSGSLSTWIYVNGSVASSDLDEGDGEDDYCSLTSICQTIIGG